MMRRLLAVTIGNLVLVLFFSHVVLAQSATDPIGQVVWVRGDVHAVRPSEATRTLERRSGIYIEDTIVTGAGSTGQIIFTDQSTLSLTSNTTVAIKDYAFTRGQTTGDEKEVIALVKGGFRTITGLVAKNNPAGYEVKTPVATIGVRGTDFSLFYSAATGLSVSVSRGEITLTNDSGRAVLNFETAKFAKIVSSVTAPQIQPRGGLQMPAIQPATLQFGPSGVLQCR